MDLITLALAKKQILGKLGQENEHIARLDFGGAKPSTILSFVDTPFGHFSDEMPTREQIENGSFAILKSSDLEIPLIMTTMLDIPEGAIYTAENLLGKNVPVLAIAYQAGDITVPGLGTLYVPKTGLYFNIDKWSTFNKDSMFDIRWTQYELNEKCIPDSVLEAANAYTDSQRLGYKQDYRFYNNIDFETAQPDAEFMGQPLYKMTDACPLDDEFSTMIWDDGNYKLPVEKDPKLWLDFDPMSYGLLTAGGIQIPVVFIFAYESGTHTVTIPEEFGGMEAEFYAPSKGIYCQRTSGISNLECTISWTHTEKIPKEYLPYSDDEIVDRVLAALPTWEGGSY